MLHSHANEHIATVMDVAEHGIGSTRAFKHEDIIKASWFRCLNQHGLDPTRPQQAVILPHNRLREHQDRLEEFLHIARHGLETLYHQVSGLGYCVLLTDAKGVTVDFIGDLVFEPSLRKAGLYLGADWSEAVAGTCGVGTCIATGEALTVHLTDHFDATHIPLTCTTSPVFNAHGDLMAVLDISQLQSSQPKDSQHLALQLVKSYAQHIENAAFMRMFQTEWVLKLSTAPQFLDVKPDYLVALDATGKVLGHNRRAQLLLQGFSNEKVIGKNFEDLFNLKLQELTRFSAGRATDQNVVTLAKGGSILFMIATPPPTVSQPGVSHVVTFKIPAPLAELSGGDIALDRQIERAAKLVNTPVSVLLTGETGTGKEYFAKAIHGSSERRSRPFIAVNCAAIPETLIESELFGHRPGSFSGSGSKSKVGLIQAAHGGTLFLDEIGDMPMPLQSRLLRVLAEKEVLPVGATQPIPVDIRVIAATHFNIEHQVRAGKFRDDLFYRLAGARINLPPLRSRTDLSWLIQRMLSMGLDDEASVPTLLCETEKLLHAHKWPGNLRELRNTLDYAKAVCSDGQIGLADLPDAISIHEEALIKHPQTPPKSSIASADAALLMQYMRAANWNVTLVSKQLGVSRMTLYRRMKRYGIEVPESLH